MGAAIGERHGGWRSDQSEDVDAVVKRVRVSLETPIADARAQAGQHLLFLRSNCSLNLTITTHVFRR